MSNMLEFEGTGGGIAPALMQAAGQPYRNYALQGVKMLQADYFGPAIPTQYEMARMLNPNIETVIMTGGGNDILLNPTLLSDCQMGNDACKNELALIGQALDALWMTMANDGVKDIVYIQYPENVGPISPGDRKDEGIALPGACGSTSPVRCHFVDVTDVVMKEVAADGVHPLAAANQRIAALVYALMVQDRIRR